MIPKVLRCCVFKECPCTTWQYTVCASYSSQLTAPNRIGQPVTETASKIHNLHERMESSNSAYNVIVITIWQKR